MATNHPSSNHADEDYIDMEVSSSSSSNFFCYSINSPPQSREFEFQMSSAVSVKETTTSPADELFYKGNLLPLHIPPRLQMVQKLLQDTNTNNFENTTEPLEEENHCFPFIKSSTTPSTNATTPLESCNISPSESCRVSCELNTDEYFFEWSTELSGFISDNPKKSWSKKFKLIKQSLIGQKLKGSRAYLKSLFSKSACSDESSAKAASHRKSFSGAIKWHSTTKSSSSSSSSGACSLSSSFSINSSGFYELQFFKRSSSAISEIESSIESAIAHCKQSQRLFNSGKKSSEVGLCSLSASRIAVSADKER